LCSKEISTEAHKQKTKTKKIPEFSNLNVIVDHIPSVDGMEVLQKPQVCCSRKGTNEKKREKELGASDSGL
jgi:hypothetical protein